MFTSLPLKGMEFRFKRFSVHQDRSAMKLGTDSVLLGCLSSLGDVSYILDIGTGTGVLALMMAQRTKAQVTGIELDAEAASEARDNANQSPWANRIEIMQGDIRQYAPTQAFDLIICNPPYFVAQNNMVINEKQRQQARHSVSLTFDELLHAINRLMTKEGQCWMIIPTSEFARLTELAGTFSLYISHQINIYPKPEKMPNRIILGMGRRKVIQQVSDFIVYATDGKPTRAYIETTRDFYLWKEFDQDDRLKI